MSALRWIAILWIVAPLPIVGEVFAQIRAHPDYDNRLFPFVLAAGAWFLAYSFWSWRGDNTRLPIAVLSLGAALLSVTLTLFIIAGSHSGIWPLGVFLPFYGLLVALLGSASFISTFRAELWR